MVARAVLRQFLENEHFYVRECTVSEFTRLNAIEKISIIFIDLGTSEFAFDWFIKQIAQKFGHIPVIIMDEPNDNQEHRNFCEKHAFSYRTIPCQRNELLHDIKLAFKYLQKLQENLRLRRSIGIPTHKMDFCEYPGITTIKQKQIMAYASNDDPVLITGEKGVGKGLVARQIHINSSRKDEPMFVVSCDTLLPHSLEIVLFGQSQDTFSETPNERLGLLELAHHGTIYFERISEMPFSVQKILCRFLKEQQTSRNGSKESNPPDVRIIAGSQINLAEACQQGVFLQELYDLLCVSTIYLPTLSEMNIDISSFANSFIKSYTEKNQLTQKVLSNSALYKLTHYHWPGNFREFHRVMYRACVNAKNSIITEQNIIFDSKMSLNDRKTDGKLGLAGMTLSKLECCLLLETLALCGGRAETARQLGISEKTIYNKFKQYKLKDKVKKGTINFM